jgi:hypothetical protein
MSQQNALNVDELWDETHRLTSELQALQLRLDGLQPPPADEQEDEDVWNVWPYSWAVQGWNLSRDCFHSFHGNLAGRQLAHRNRKVRAAYVARLDQASGAVMSEHMPQSTSATSNSDTHRICANTVNQTTLHLL